MKTKPFGKKLDFNKTTVVNLNGSELKEIKGGTGRTCYAESNFGGSHCIGSVAGYCDSDYGNYCGGSNGFALCI